MNEEDKKEPQEKPEELTGEELEAHIDKAFEESLADADNALVKADTPDKQQIATRHRTNVKDWYALSKPMPTDAVPEPMRDLMPEPGDNPTEFNIMCCMGERSIAHQLKLAQIARINFDALSEEDRVRTLEEVNIAMHELYASDAEINMKIIDIMGGKLPDVDPHKEIIDITPEGITLSRRQKMLKRKDYISDRVTKVCAGDFIDGKPQAKIGDRLREILWIDFETMSTMVKYIDTEFLTDSVSVNYWIFVDIAGQSEVYRDPKELVKNHTYKLV